MSEQTPQQIPVQGFIESLKAQRNFAQDQVAELSAMLGERTRERDEARRALADIRQERTQAAGAPHSGAREPGHLPEQE